MSRLVFWDLKAIHQLRPDVVIVDEAQRIKNWQTRTCTHSLVSVLRAA